MGIVDWLADKVQKSTGEKDRRQGVAKIKELVFEFRSKVSEAVNAVNVSIEKFNHWVQQLNNVRAKKIGQNITDLQTSLLKYGNCKSREAYADEDLKANYVFPEKEYQTLEDYINEIDWTSDDVFRNTFLLGPLGMKFKTRKQNVQLKESANNLTLLIDETLRELEILKFSTELETEICQLYIDNILFISDIINKIIVPELKIVEAFCEAEKIKDIIISNRELQQVGFDYEISALIGTKYERHYQFIKNAFAFYVLACRIYDTPVLTRLLEHNANENDKTAIIKENELLQAQSGRVRLSVCF